jgi:hypothetical protein
MATKTQVQEQKNTQKEASSSKGNPIDVLAEYGGFSFVENIIDGFSNLNPKRKARRNIFLNDEQWENERKNLTNRLNVWLEILKKEKDITAMSDVAKKKSAKAEQVLNSNLLKALNVTEELERSYRSVALFYKNTESDKVKNVTIVNADLDQIKDLDNGCTWLFRV